MATDRQITANRHNASRSTGPRSRAGKKRAAGNATLHGLTTKLLAHTTLAEQVEELAREIAGGTEDAILVQYARDAAYAEIELARVRRVRVALIDRISAVQTPDGPSYEVRGIRNFIDTLARGEVSRRIDPLAAMSAGGDERTAEAMRRALPLLTTLARYESRAAGRRDKAIRRIIKGKRAIAVS